MTTKLVNGKRVACTQADLDEIAAKEASYAAEADQRALDAVKEARVKAYGSVETQLEYLVENGLDALISRNNAIKAANPKPQ